MQVMTAFHPLRPQFLRTLPSVSLHHELCYDSRRCGGCVMNDVHNLRSYYRTRERQERDAAEQATSDVARYKHQDLADRYRHLAEEAEMARATTED